VFHLFINIKGNGEGAKNKEWEKLFLDRKIKDLSTKVHFIKMKCMDKVK
jgi:hypothetical protein